MTPVTSPLLDSVVESRKGQDHMKNRIAILMFLGILLTGHSFAQVETRCSTSGTSSNGNIDATTDCTSTDTGAEKRRQEAIQAERDRQNAVAWANVGNGISDLMLRHQVKKGIEKYCDQHQGEPWTWQVNGQALSGTCPGTYVWTKARVVDDMNASHRRGNNKDGKVAYTEAKGDTMITHSERASAMRFHANMANQPFLSKLQSAGFSTYIYTNDADLHFEFDITHNREITADGTAVAGTPQSVATPTTTPAATVPPAAPPH